MVVAVDTNAVIAYRAGISSVCSLIEEADIIFLPVVVLGELLYGATNSFSPEKNKEAIYNFLAQSSLLPIDETVAISYANTRSDLKKMGSPIPENDLWIAATCLRFYTPLLTNDSHFEHIYDLQVINWTKGGRWK